MNNHHEEVHTNEDHLSLLRKQKQRKLKRIILGLFSVSIFFIIVTIYSQYEVYVLKKLVASNDIASSEIPTTPNQIIEAVSRHIVLPDTVPQIAAVQDAKKLSTSQTFFENAENGDVVLVYESTIFLYRPSKDILIAIGDITNSGKK